MAEFGAAPIGAGVTLGAAFYTAATGFVVRRESDATLLASNWHTDREVTEKLASISSHPHRVS